MRGERYQNGMVMLLTVLVFAAIPLLVNLPAWWFLWVPVEAALAVLPAVFLREVDIGTSPRSPGDVRETLSSTLRTAGVSMTAAPGAVSAQVNALSTVRFRSRITEAGAVLSYQVRPTVAGWALLAILGVSVVGSTVAIVLTVALAWQARRFARVRGSSAMAASAPASTPSASDQVRGLLVGSLSFGLHMAEQAYEAQRKAYTDARVLAVLGAFVLWTVLLVALFVALSVVPIWASIAAVLAGITAWIWYRWRRREDTRLAESKSAWDAHVRALRARMDRFLEEM